MTQFLTRSGYRRRRKKRTAHAYDNQINTDGCRHSSINHGRTFLRRHKATADRDNCPACVNAVPPSIQSTNRRLIQPSIFCSCFNRTNNVKNKTNNVTFGRPYCYLYVFWYIYQLTSSDISKGELRVLSFENRNYFVKLMNILFDLLIRAM